MPQHAAVTNLCTYRVRPDREDAFRSALARHWPALRDAGLAPDTPPLVLRGEQGGAPVYYEVCSWTRPDGPDLAHQTPHVMAVWEAMGMACEERAGRPGMEFPVVEPVDLDAL